MHIQPVRRALLNGDGRLAEAGVRLEGTSLREGLGVILFNHYFKPFYIEV
jgi:hypothetical protein